MCLHIWANVTGCLPVAEDVGGARMAAETSAGFGVASVKITQSMKYLTGRGNLCTKLYSNSNTMKRYSRGIRRYWCLHIGANYWMFTCSRGGWRSDDGGGDVSWVRGGICKNPTVYELSLIHI